MGLATWTCLPFLTGAAMAEPAPPIADTPVIEITGADWTFAGGKWLAASRARGVGGSGGSADPLGVFLPRLHALSYTHSWLSPKFT